MLRVGFILYYFVVKFIGIVKNSLFKFNFVVICNSIRGWFGEICWVISLGDNVGLGLLFGIGKVIFLLLIEFIFIKLRIVFDVLKELKEY